MLWVSNARESWQWLHSWLGGGDDNFELSLREAVWEIVGTWQIF